MTVQTLQTVVELLPTFGDRPAVGVRQTFGLRWWSYRRLHDEAYRCAGVLRDRGVRPGTRILLWAPNCPEWVGVLLGAMLCNAVVVPVDAGASPDLARRIADESGAALVVHGPSQDVAALARPALSIYAAGEREATAASPTPWPAQPDDPALVLYTSGSTMQPKGVLLTHRNLAAQVRPFWAWRRGVRLIAFRILVLAPLSHSQGLVLGICVPLAVGLSVIYTDSVDPAHLMRTVKDNRVTLLATVPRVLQLLVKALGQRPYGRRGPTLEQKLIAGQRWGWWLRRHVLFLATHAALGYRFWVVLVGGAALPRDDERFWFDAGYVLVQGYGLTETAAIVSVNGPWSGRFGSIGRPLGEQVVRIADDGEILVRGPNVSPGYVHDSPPPADAFFRTGDLGWRDARDRLYFLGRKKEVIVTGEGLNVFPGEVEAALTRQPGVRDAVVVGLERQGHEDVHATLLLDRGSDPARVVQQANARLERHQKIASWTVWPGEDFPRTSLLKPRREEVLAWLRLRRGAPEPEPGQDAAGPPSLDVIRATPDPGLRLRLLARYVAETAADPAAAPLRLVEDLGLSSLGIVELLSLIERQRQTVIEPAALREGATVADLRAMVDDAGPASGRAARRATPGWVDHPLVNRCRPLLASAILPAWFALRARLVVHGLHHLASLEPPFMAAAAHHEHGIDVMAVYCALPRRLRRRLFVLTTRWAFRDYFDPAPGTPRAKRVAVAAAFYVGMPVLLPFTLVPHLGTTRDGLFETCRLIDRGFSLVMFPEGEPGTGGLTVQPGVGLIAAQTQVPILPLRFGGNEGIDFRPRRHRAAVTVRFGEPIRVRADATPDQVTRRLQDAYRCLA